MPHTICCARRLTAIYACCHAFDDAAACCHATAIDFRFTRYAAYGHGAAEEVHTRCLARYAAVDTAQHAITARAPASLRELPPLLTDDVIVLPRCRRH